MEISEARKIVAGATEENLAIVAGSPGAVGELATALATLVLHGREGINLFSEVAGRDGKRIDLCSDHVDLLRSLAGEGDR